MKKIENIEIKKINGKAIMQADGKPLTLLDMAITALEGGKNLGFKVYRTGQKLVAMQDVGAKEIILEDSEFDGVKRAILSGPFLDFALDQAEEALSSAAEYKIKEV